MKVSILGATGIIGQQFVRMLADHPKFDLHHLYASERSAGSTIGDIWQLPNFDCPQSVVHHEIEDISHLDDDFEIAFSALPSDVAINFEADLRAAGIKVFSNAGAHRMDEDVPILIPEINADHIQLVDIQQDKYDTDGFIITNSNCSAAGAAIYLGELKQVTEIKTGVITTYQALSGAGIGGVAALDINGNVLPYIGNEEPKIIAETKKINGSLADNQIKPFAARLLANAARVNVSDGHLEAISCFTKDKITDNQLAELKTIQSPLDITKFHVAPTTHLNYMEKEDRPQPILDVFRSDDNPASAGMTVHTGRIRVIDSDISAYVLVHNTIRGGAGGSVLNAEYALNQGYI